MSIYDADLRPLLCELANSMDRLERMHAWAEHNNNFAGSGLAVSWVYGQYDDGFHQIKDAVQVIVRERISELLAEAIKREAERASGLHKQIRERMQVQP